MPATFRIVLWMLLCLPLQAVAQADLPAGDRYEYYYRLLQVSGITDDKASFHLRPFTPTHAISGSHPWEAVYGTGPEPVVPGSGNSGLYMYEPVFFQSYNTTLPRGHQDGAVWQGKGYNSAVSVGAAGVFGPLHIRFRPQAGMAQNRAFDLGPYEPPEIRSGGFRIQANEYAYRDFRGGIDYVQRFGDGTYSWTDLGESSAELRFRGVRAGVSNARIWVGPAMQTSLQYGYNAPGFLHAFIGTYRPLETAIGSFEAAYIFGGLRKSDYFDNRTDNNLESVNSLYLNYSPPFSNHFSIGLMRSFYMVFPDSFEEYRQQAGKLFEAGLKNSLGEGAFDGGRGSDNQIVNLFMRYVIPEHGIEMYLDYGRNDHNANWRDLREHPENHRAYTVGILKSFLLEKNRLFAVGFEMNQLETSRVNLARGRGHLGGWYTHSRIVQGLSNRGQLLGTGIGPGGNMQMLRGDLFEERGSLGVKLGRIVYHNSRLDQYFDFIQEANPEQVEPWEVRNIEYMLGMEMTAFLPYNIELSAGLEQSFIMNHHNLKENDKWNTRLELVVRKRIPGWLR